MKVIRVQWSSLVSILAMKPIILTWINMKKVLIAFFIIIPVGYIIGDILHFFGAANYEECYLAEMKGQDNSMMSVAGKVCAKRFKIEQYIYYREVDLSWSTFEGGIKISVEKNESEFDISSATLLFSGNSCNKSKKEGFNIKKNVTFSSGIGIIPLKGLELLSYKCMRTDEVRGTYK